MKLYNRCAAPFLFAVCGLIAAYFSYPNVGVADPGGESTQEEQARQQIMNSPQWTEAKQRFDEWLSVQTAYNKAEVVALESELRNRTAGMSAQELGSFLEEMEAKTAALMSPAAMDARRWVAKYSDKARLRISKEHGVEDPLSLSTVEIESALRQFAAERQSKMASAAAFDRSRAGQAQAVKSYNQTQAKAARTAASYRPPSRSPYTPRNTPRRPQVYSASYPKMNYSMGPWGGVRIRSGRR